LSAFDAACAISAAPAGEVTSFRRRRHAQPERPEHARECLADVGATLQLMYKAP
jgi:hypothetical protein